MAKKKLSKFVAISMAAAMMLTAMMPTIPVFAEETECPHWTQDYGNYTKNQLVLRMEKLTLSASSVIK